MISRSAPCSAPDFEFVNLINYPRTTEQLSAFKGKLVILYFWSSHCGVCLTSFPKLEKLQPQFEGSVRIMLVDASGGEDVVRKVFKRRKKLTGQSVGLPTVCGDSVIRRRLPTLACPLLSGSGETVWCGQRRTVHP